MSDKLQQGLEELLSMLVETLREGGQFVADQTPLVVQEFLNWAIVKSSLGILLGLLFLGLGLFCLQRLLSNWKDIDSAYWKDGAFGTDMSGIGVLCTFTAGIGSTIGVIITSINIYTLAYVLTAPRVYLIEQISSFL